MMKSIKPSEIKGTIKAPASKSMMQRAIAAALLAERPVKILNPTYSSDSKAALSVIQRLGAGVDVKENEIMVKGGMNPTGEILNCGESGLSIRMFSPIAALWHRELTLTGEGSLLKRPVAMIEGPLKELGVRVATSGGCPPLTVQGPLKGGQAHVDGSVSSQLLTGLLMALPTADGDSRLVVEDLKSTPYIDMTLSLLGAFGIEVRHSNYHAFSIAGKQTYSIAGGEYRVEGDWSGAAFLLVCGALGGSVTVTGLDMDSPQADRGIVDALKAAGAVVKLKRPGGSFRENAARTPLDPRKSFLRPFGQGECDMALEVAENDLKGFHFDATHCPDLFPPLVALACNCKGTTVIEGVERLKYKESNRALVLEKEFSALGAEIRVAGNRMEIKGKKLKGGVIDSHNDHRIAMAAAAAAVNGENDVTIRDYQCVAKSYPGFFEDFQTIGGNVYE